MCANDYGRIRRGVRQERRRQKLSVKPAEGMLRRHKSGKDAVHSLLRWMLIALRAS